jgi:formate hydrogenlyase transcriptional activator
MTKGTVEKERVEMLLDISNAVVSNLNLRDLVDSLSNCLKRFLEFDLAALYIYESETHVLREQILDPDESAKLFDKGIALPIDGSASGTAFKTRKIVIANSEDFKSFAPEVAERARAAGLGSTCSLPLLSGDNAIGVLTFMSFTDRNFSQAAVDLLEQVATQITLAVVNALSYQKVDREKERFGMLLEVSNALSAVLDLKDVLKITSSILRRHIKHDHAGIGLYVPELDHFRILAFENAPEAFQDEGTTWPAKETPDELAFRSKQIVMRNRIDLSEFPSPLVKLAYDAGFRSFCIVPLISRNKAIGVMAVANNEEDSLTPHDAETIQLIANQVAGAIENAVQFDEIEKLKNQLASEKLYLEEEIQSEYNFAEIVGHSAGLLKVLRQIETVAPTDSCVLLYGETGTGKELFSRAIHNLSKRRERTLVKLNCAAIPTGLLESELFGHEKGAFTGAVASRVGRFELAHRGTLLLDEIGDIPLELQPKLLRVLQESEFERLGSSRTVRTDVRLIAATNRDLRAMVEEKTFRSDLYYRLNVFPIHIPPLRERPEDIPLLAGYFAKKHSARMSKRIEAIPRESIDALCAYDFPGNVRELENFIERAVILTRGEELQIPISELRHFQRPVTDDGVPVNHSLEAIERNHIAEVLKSTGGRIAGAGGAAEVLNLPVSTLRHRIKKLGLS